MHSNEGCEEINTCNGKIDLPKIRTKANLITHRIYLQAALKALSRTRPQASQ
ncbi:MAG: hypothetical protein WBZ20_05390 [Nitrososphaeraceae archaeon]